MYSIFFHSYSQVAVLSTVHQGASLRDFTMADWEQVKDKMSDVSRRRSLHVIAENQRVLEAEEALKGGDLKRLGELMNASHASLRDNYEVSSPELDWLTETARSISGRVLEYFVSPFIDRTSLYSLKAAMALG
jgi:galactokinase